MNKWWNKWFKKTDEFDEWEYSFEDKKSDYKLFKQIVISLGLFAAVYLLRYVDSDGARLINGQIAGIVNSDTDFGYWAGKAAEQLPQSFNDDFFQRVQSVMARPADPLEYMSVPVDGALAAGFGSHKGAEPGGDYWLDGLEYKTVLGDNVRAASLGRVKRVAVNDKMGQFIIISHGRDFETVYGYLGEVLVKEGDRVSQGQIIAKTDQKPSSLEPLFYFELREKSMPVDPMQRIKGKFAGQ